MTVLPSGDQHEIVHGDQRAVVTGVGGGLREYRAGGRAVLEGFAAEEMCTGARGQLLLPWPNRVADGRWTWRGQALQLDLTEAPAGNAIHGLVRWANWTPAVTEAAHVRLTHRLHPHPGYPFSLDLAVDYRLGDAGLEVRTSARNVGARPAPFAAGAHPYLAVDGGPVDSWLLELRADRWIETDGRGIPTGERPVAGSDFDFTTPRAVGDTKIDNAFTGLAREADERVRMRLRHPDGHGAELWLDSAFGYLELFTGDSLPDPDRRRTGLGVEPMTAPPNALATGTDLVVLEPGDGWAGSWGIRPL